MKQRLATGRTLIIANPQAQSGRSRMVAERLQRFLALIVEDPAQFDLVYTERARHAIELAAGARGYRTVIALGGDGVIHEVANGLMAHDAATRPQLGVLPVGSGNDFAMTLGIPECTGDDFSSLIDARPRTLDVGRIHLDPGTAGGGVEYFVETCSVGLDAAIGIDTYQLRRTTHLKGNALYLASGLRMFGRGYRAFPLTFSLDDEPPRALTPHIFTVQNGPTYGSGFKVCPMADPADGLFDICYADGPRPRRVTLPVFLSARDGKHVNAKVIHFARARRVALELAEAGYPIQADGEQLHASRLEIEMVPGALTVLTPPAP